MSKIPIHLILGFGIVLMVSSCASTEGLRPETLPDGLKSVMVEEIPVVYSDQGTGDILVIFTTYPFGIRHWEDLSGPLSATMRVIVIEPPGFRDPLSMKGDYSSEHLLQIYRTFFRNQKLKKAHIIGVGEGGGLAIAFGHHFPEHILTAVSINGFEAVPWNEEVRPGIDLTYGVKDKEIRKLLSLGTLRYRNHVLPKKELRGLLDLRKLPAYTDTARSRKEGLIQDLRAAYIPSMIESVYFPVLLIHSEHDELLPKKFIERTHQVILGSKITSLSDAGHFAFIDRPEELAEMILGFIRENPEPVETEE
ncbi:MAG TPA: alpha/beta hydrolase [Nitrospiria bacterium]